MVLFHFRYLRLQAEFIKKNYDCDENHQNEFVNNFLELENYAQFFLNLAIKYKIVRKITILKRILKMIKYLKDKDIEILNQYINYLMTVQ